MAATSGRQTVTRKGAAYSITRLDGVKFVSFAIGFGGR